jgi:hypothetical protein
MGNHSGARSEGVYKFLVLSATSVLHKPCGAVT